MPRASQCIARFLKKEITSLLSSARRVCRHSGLDIRISPTSATIGRILIITPRKSGSSPERNRIRRRLKAIFYEERLFLHPYNWLVFIKKEAQELSFAQLKKALLSCSSEFDPH
jgi:ribonuclease P protein component